MHHAKRCKSNNYNQLHKSIIKPQYYLNGISLLLYGISHSHISYSNCVFSLNPCQLTENRPVKQTASIYKKQKLNYWLYICLKATESAMENAVKRILVPNQENTIAMVDN
jgi:hypothetical protein